MMAEDHLDRLVAEVQTSRKARAIDPDLVRQLCRAEMAGHRTNDKETVKRVKRTLHRIGGSYFTGAARYDRWLVELEEADPEQRTAIVDRILVTHLSMRERLDRLDDYYRALFDGLEYTTSVIDLGCGFHPLALDRMPIEPTTYIGCDIYLDMLDFIERASRILGHPVDTMACNLMAATPDRHVEVALLLKTLPCLDQAGHDIGRRVLEEIRADHVLVTYPVHSLGGRSKGMAANYRDQFHRLVEPLAWEAEEFDLPDELGFRLSQPD